MKSLVRSLACTSAFAVCALFASACDRVGNIEDPPLAAQSGAGGAGTGTTSGAGGSAVPTAGTGGPGAAGASGVAGAAGGGAAGMNGGAGTGTGGSGSAGTSGAAGSGSSAGSAGTSGAAGSGSSSGAAGTTGAAGSAPLVTMPHCKRGEAYQANSLNDLKVLSKGISWYYNWSTAPEKSAGAWATAGVEFVPMVWGIKGGLPDPATIEKQIPAGSKYILGFNEPNRGDQSNITAAMAAQLWPRIEQIAKDKNLLIGSPSPQYCAGNCNDTDPFHWLDAFFAACTGCKVDFIATHWYACTADALNNHLSKFKKYGKPVWVTEFSCMDSGDQSAAGEAAYMKTAVDILEKNPMVFRYSWFTGRWPNPSGISLLAGDGMLTDLGNQYMTLPATDTCGAL